MQCTPSPPNSLCLRTPSLLGGTLPWVSLSLLWDNLHSLCVELELRLIFSCTLVSRTTTLIDPMTGKTVVFLTRWFTKQKLNPWNLHVSKGVTFAPFAMLITRKCSQDFIVNFMLCISIMKILSVWWISFLPTYFNRRPRRQNSMSPGSCETPTECRGFCAFKEQPNFLELHSHGRAFQGSEYSNSQSPQLGKWGCQPLFSSQGHPTLMSSLGLEI